MMALTKREKEHLTPSQRDTVRTLDSMALSLAVCYGLVVFAQMGYEGAIRHGLHDTHKAAES